MISPFIKPLTLDPNIISLETDLLFFTDIPLKLSSNIEKTNNLDLKKSHLISEPLQWTPSPLWLYRVVKEETKPWTGTDTFQLIRNILLLTEALDVEATGMLSNGGNGGCRYEEMAKREEVKELFDLCLVKFEENTLADVSIQIRKIKNSSESGIHLFRLRYDKNIYKDVFPDNQVRVQGFQFLPLPEKEVPFDQAISPLKQQGYSLRYMIEPSGLLSIPILSYPIFKFMDEANEKLELTKDFLLSLGITQREHYTEAHTDHFKFPQKVSDFLQLITHIEADDEKISVVNINKLRGYPDLFNWLSFQSLNWTSRLREGKLEIPHLGSFTFNNNKGLIEIHSRNGSMTISLSHLEISEAVFKIDNHEIHMKGMRLGKISTQLPAFANFIQQIKEGKFNEENLTIGVEDFFVEELSIRDTKSQITTHLHNTSIPYIQLDKIHLEYFNSGEFKASLTFLGKVNHLQLQQGPHFQLNLKQAEFHASPLMIQIKLNPETQKLDNIQYDFDFDIQSTSIDRSQLGQMTLAPSVLRNSRLRLIQTENNLSQIPQIDFQGELDIHLESILGNEESFNIPGLAIRGEIYDIALQGPLHLKVNPEGWGLEKAMTSSQNKIQAKAQIRNVALIHDPHLIAGNNLSEWPFHEVVKTDLGIDSADFFIDDLERIEFYENETTHPGSGFRNVEIRDIRFENIHAQGVIWAEFPLFYYMRGVFPEIGTREIDSKLAPSFVSLKRFSMHSSEQGNPLTLLEEFETEIYEVDGHKAFAKVHIPLLTIGLQGNHWVDTSNQINKADLYLLDPARGGWVKLKSLPRPLEYRRSRLIPEN